MLQKKNIIDVTDLTRIYIPKFEHLLTHLLCSLLCIKLNYSIPNRSTACTTFHSWISGAGKAGCTDSSWFDGCCVRLFSWWWLKNTAFWMWRHVVFVTFRRRVLHLRGRRICRINTQPSLWPIIKRKFGANFCWCDRLAQEPEQGAVCLGKRLLISLHRRVLGNKGKVVPLLNYAMRA
jgi:hypothetical protein